MKRAVAVVSLVVVPFTLGCGKVAPLAPRVAREPSPDITATAPLPGARTPVPAARHTDVTAQHVEGSIGPGSIYGIDLPASWNGDLVVYAHGYVPPFLPVMLPTEGAGLRQRLLGEGYALAYSSYSENGFDVRDAAQRTAQLSSIFASRFQKPDHTFLIGVSLGAIPALELVEEHPRDYDGALLASGVVGGTRLEIDYISTVRVLFDYFYPGVLPGTAIEVPNADFNGTIVPAVVGAIQANPQGAGAMVSIAQDTCLPFASPTEIVTSILTALGFEFIEGGDFLSHTHDHVYFDNSGTVYTGALPQPLLDDLNARVARFSATPDAANFLNRDYQPTGRLSIPVLTMHTSRDPLVPACHETAYHDLVAAAGRGDFLSQRLIDRYGHFTFTDDELQRGFDDLVAWVHSGVRP